MSANEMEIIDTGSARAEPDIDVSDYHRAVESLRLRDELESARIEATEFRVRLDGAQATIKRVTAERDRAQSDLERRSAEVGDLRADAAAASSLANERKHLVAAANDRAARAESALADLQAQLIAGRAPTESIAEMAGGIGEGLREEDGDGFASASGNVFSRMLQELRRLG